MDQYHPKEWHPRYLEQAKWTSELRTYLINLAGIGRSSLTLDVGCGTGALFEDIAKISEHIHGLDIRISSLKYAKMNKSAEGFIQGDGQVLPLKDDTYDLVFCHYLLMWIPEPERVVKEMTRVTKPGGSVMAFAEPDYGGRIDYPDALSVLGKIQIDSLIEQGANPSVGRKLAALFSEAGLTSIRTGVIGGEWFGPPNWKAWDSEWHVLESDLVHSTSGLSKETIDHLKIVDRQDRELGKRILYVPTFYASGVAKKPT